MKRFSFFFLIIPVFLLVGCTAGNKSSTLPSTGSSSASANTPSPDERANDTNTPSASSEQEPREVVDLEPIRIEVVGRDRIGDPELEAFDARTLLDRGNEAMAEDRYDDAIVSYEKLLSVFPDSQLASSAVYNIGLAYEGKGDYDNAIEQYRVLARDPKLEREAIDAHMRIGGILAQLKRWADAAQALRDVLSRTDLTHSNRIEAMARLGYVTLEQKDYTASEQVLREAIVYFEKLTTGLDTNYFIAMSHYYLAHIAHRQFQALPMRLPNEQLQKDFQAKTKLVNLAYDRYVSAVQIQHAYWATASGYQLSQIYKEFWDEIVRAPVPKDSMSAGAAELYPKELHKQVRVLLEKALNGHTQNVELAKAYRTSTTWSEASRKRAAEIADILARESSGELVVPERANEQTTTDEGPKTRPEYVPQRVEL